MSRTLLLLLSAKADAKNSLAAALAHFENSAATTDIALSAGVSQGDAFLDGTAHGEVMGERDRFDAFLRARSDSIAFADLARSLAPICASLRQYLDVDRSAVLAGVERSILPGDGAELMTFAFRRKPALTQAACHAYWHDQHGAIARNSGTSGYRQLHVDTPASKEIAQQLEFGVADYDGAVIKVHAGVDVLHATLSNAMVRTVALPDERVFIDHARSGMVAFKPIERQRN